MVKLTEEQFKKELEGFFAWCSPRTRKPSQWYQSLEEYAARRFEQSYRLENPKKEE